MVKDINYYRAIHNSKGCKTRAEMEKNQIRKRLDRNFENTLDIVEFEKDNTFVFLIFFVFLKFLLTDFSNCYIIDVNITK